MAAICATDPKSDCSPPVVAEGAAELPLPLALALSVGAEGSADDTAFKSRDTDSPDCVGVALSELELGGAELLEDGGSDELLGGGEGVGVGASFDVVGGGGGGVLDVVGGGGGT